MDCRREGAGRDAGDKIGLRESAYRRAGRIHKPTVGHDELLPLSGFKGKYVVLPAEEYACLLATIAILKEGSASWPESGAALTRAGTSRRRA